MVTGHCRVPTGSQAPASDIKATNKEPVAVFLPHSQHRLSPLSSGGWGHADDRREIGVGVRRSESSCPQDRQVSLTSFCSSVKWEWSHIFLEDWFGIYNLGNGKHVVVA